MYFAISIDVSMKIVLEGRINDKASLVQLKGCRQPGFTEGKQTGKKLLYKPLMRLLWYMCVPRP